MPSDSFEIKNVCVFAGSSPGNRNIYSETAKELAWKLTENNYGIVYGGGSNGLMGILGNSAIDACLLYTSPSPRDKRQSRMPSSA